MARLLLYLLSTATVLCSCAQGNPKSVDNRKELSTTLELLTSSTLKADYGTLYDLSLPLAMKLPKAEMLEQIEQGMNNEDYSLQIKKVRIDSVSEIIVKDTAQYAVFMNVAAVVLTVKRNGYSDEIFKNRADEMYRRMKESIGDFVNVKKENDSMFYAEQIQYSWAVYFPHYKGWRIINETSRDVVDAVIPATVRRRIGR